MVCSVSFGLIGQSDLLELCSVQKNSEALFIGSIH